MTIEKTNIEGAYIIQNNYIEDERGYFFKTFCNDELKKSGIDFEVKQSNMSYSAKRNIKRDALSDCSLCRNKSCKMYKGKVFDAIADIRKDSPTFGQHFTVELSEENGKMIYIPPYVAHGIETLEDHSMICYFVGASFVPNAYGYLRWNDPFNIDWPIKDNLIMSEKDKSIPDFEY
ncbi:dTDP-4-dehydrorhamnose 3,5-epimerase family protein [Brachyspira hyodysenteriae]|nr:dTDP-4-dehydrorhamnose 3,5-epimerase family protein [Brachyspira hyodysenteriae]MDA1470437.1 dTDP-4-dehydrorhamnose 3,5-epimerase family protein [Brachyspira hyodysenteriae]